MREFAQLLESLSYTQSRLRKLSLLTGYLRSVPDPDRGWALAVLTDGLPRAVLGSSRLRAMLADLTSRFIDPVLYKMSRDYVGDTAETVALLWPDKARPAVTPSLKCVVEAMQDAKPAERTELLGRLLDQFNVSERWALLKLLGGAPRVGVSARLAKTAVAKAFGRDVGEIEEL